MVAPAGQSLVCFQAHSNASCVGAVGPKQCSAQGRCVHTDVSGGLDESTLQACHAGYVEIQLFRNSSSCRPSARVYGFNTSLSGCQNVGGYWGQMTCGKGAGCGLRAVLAAG